MQKWEYKIGGISEKWLNQLGEEGWEVVAVVASSIRGLADPYDYSIEGWETILKRPKAETPSTLPPIRK